VCEGEKAWLQCRQYEVIKVLRIFWGREDDQICRNPPRGLTVNKVCESNTENAFNKVSAQCRNQQGCEIVASNIFFDDDTCGEVYKYLKICYECMPDEANAVDVLLEKRKKKKRKKRGGEKERRHTKEKRSSETHHDNVDQRHKRELYDGMDETQFINKVINTNMEDSWKHPAHSPQRRGARK